jgi:nucleoside-triphosphatase THEP1
VTSTRPAEIERFRGLVFALTGERGSGKTSICNQVVADARARGLDVAGIITGRSGPEPDAPREVVDIRSGHARLFGAKLTPAAHADGGVGAQSSVLRSSISALPAAATDAHDAGTTSDPLTPGWEYDAEVFAWATETLSQATPCDLLVVDEVGPLELVGRRGWVKALEVLRRGDFRAALAVCRPGLLDELEGVLGRPLAGTFEADLQDTVGLPALIVGAMFG